MSLLPTPKQILRDNLQSKLNLADLREESYTSRASFDYVDKPISQQEFFVKYLLPNRPCLLGSWVTEAWRNRKDWVLPNGRPNLSFLKEHFGHVMAPIADCRREKYSSHAKDDMTVADYMTYWQDYINSGYDKTHQCLYLKDWHFTKAFPEYTAYKCPSFFTSDWLNEFWDSLDDGDDYRFVYMGPKGSWTPFHADVFRSYSWSANICGEKHWIFYPPGQEDLLQDKFGRLVFDVTSRDLDDLDKFPNAGKVTPRLEVTQKQGEVIFVPSGWHHQVLNKEDTISINHNWLNACNVDFTWRFLQMSLVDVKREIADCEGMEGWLQQCQMILRASTGINYAGFYNLLSYIAHRRLQMLKSTLNFPCLKSTQQQESCASSVKTCQRETEPCSSLDDSGSAKKAVLCSDRDGCNLEGGQPEDKNLESSLEINGILFDLVQIKTVLKLMVVDFKEEDIGENVAGLIEKIETVLAAHR